MSNLSALQGIREEIASRLNEVETSNTDQYTNWINMCLGDLELSFPEAPFLYTSADRTLSSGTRQYAAPSDFGKMYGITFPTADLKMSYVSPEEYDLIQPSATEGGNPTLFTIRGQGPNAIIEYYPQPTGSITVHLNYQRQINRVSAGSATFDIPLKYYELPILYGESRGLRRRGRTQDAMAVQQQYEALKDKMMQDLMRQATENQRIRSIREYQGSNMVFDDPIKSMFWSKNT